MHETAEFLLTMGGILLLGLITNFIGKRTFLPRVTLLLLFGVLISKDGLDLIPTSFIQLFEVITDLALLMLGFLLGSKFTLSTLKNNGQQLFYISIFAALTTTILVTLGLVIGGVQLPLAIIIGCIAAATDPAATVDAINEFNRKTPFSDLLLKIVAIDDAWALIIFSIGLSMVAALMGTEDIASPMLNTTIEIGGAVILGVALGVPSAALTGKLKPNEPILSEALALVFICGGIAMWLEVSYLIASMVMGATVVNLAKHHEYAFHEIENIESPLMVIFFVLAGASLELGLLKQLGVIGAIYIVMRTIGKFSGAWIGGVFSKATVIEQRWTGLALLPQAGVAIGMALVASHQFPEYRQTLLTIVISSTVLFEILGPICTRFALVQAYKNTD